MPMSMMNERWMETAFAVAPALKCQFPGQALHYGHPQFEELSAQTAFTYARLLRHGATPASRRWRFPRESAHRAS